MFKCEIPDKLLQTMKQNKQQIHITEIRFRLQDMLCFAIWFGILSGLAEVVLPQLNELRGGKT
ncbi:MAG: hypothetical protein RQ760_09000, partial [Sedimentisphaerales bacterium]|nr:hypothetical protein [Sedimentisphaerales bacterium]